MRRTEWSVGCSPNGPCLIWAFAEEEAGEASLKVEEGGQTSVCSVLMVVHTSGPQRPPPATHTHSPPPPNGQPVFIERSGRVPQGQAAHHTSPRAAISRMRHGGVGTFASDRPWGERERGLLLISPNARVSVAKARRRLAALGLFVFLNWEE